MAAKGLRKGYVWEVSWRLNRDCNILIPPSSSVFSSTSFLFCRAAQLGALRAQSSAESWFSLPWTATTHSKLTEPVCGPGLYNCLTPTCFLWASHLHPIQPVYSQGYTLISSTGCTCSLIDGWVGGQYVTNLKKKCTVFTIMKFMIEGCKMVILSRQFWLLEMCLCNLISELKKENSSSFEHGQPEFWPKIFYFYIAVANKMLQFIFFLLTLKLLIHLMLER